MVVVCGRARRQLHSRPRRRHQGEYYSLSLGLCCRPTSGNVHCAHSKLVPSHSTRTACRLTILQSTLLYSRYGNGIATNNLSKMIAGLLVPERPIGNMYFAAWSHNVISNAVNLCNDLKMGEYREFLIPLAFSQFKADPSVQSRYRPESCS